MTSHGHITKVKEKNESQMRQNWSMSIAVFPKVYSQETWDSPRLLQGFYEHSINGHHMPPTQLTHLYLLPPVRGFPFLFPSCLSFGKDLMLCSVLYHSIHMPPEFSQDYFQVGKGFWRLKSLKTSGLEYSFKYGQHLQLGNQKKMYLTHGKDSRHFVTPKAVVILISVQQGQVT